MATTYIHLIAGLLFETPVVKVESST